MTDTHPGRVTGYLQPDARGAWQIERFRVTHADLIGQHGEILATGRGVPPGSYTRLTHHGRVIMSDTPDELRDLAPVLRRAHGRVLVNGLGLGCVVKALLATPAVTHVDVVELDADLIALVGPAYRGARCTIHHGDAFTYPWPPGARWDVVWHDIWPLISVQNLPQMAALHRRFAARCSWQASWGAAWLAEQLHQLSPIGRAAREAQCAPLLPAAS
jgi:hypothetical protein